MMIAGDHIDTGYTLTIPEPSGWVAYLVPGGAAQFRPTKGNVPNAFHRFMQRLCFGIRWYREGRR
jgi:hypothetical protein